MSGYNNEQLDRLEPTYLASLGLQQAPFTSLHEDKFLYLDAERDQCDNMLHHLTQYSNLLLIVTAEHGMGKTSLLQRFVNTADQEWSLCTVQANAMMDAQQLLANIAQGFGLQVSNQPASVLQETLYQYLVTIQHNNQIPILLVDDAHELPKDSLETLFTLADTETAEDNLLRIILFCEPQIEIMLEAPAIQPLRDRITHTIDIPAFNEEQTAEYIKHRLAVCGFTGASPFQAKDIKKIFKVSQGVPGRINKLAHLHLSDEKYINSEPEQLPDEYTQLSFSKKRLAIGVVVISLAIAVLLLQDKINSVFEEDPVTETTIATSITETPVIKEKTIEITVKPALESEQSSEPITATQSKNADLVEDSPVEDSLSSTPASTQTKTSETITKLKVPVAAPLKAHIRNSLPNPVIGNSKPQTILINGEGFSKNTQITVRWSGNKKQLAANQVTYENTNQLRVNITVGTKADNWTIQSNDPQHGQSNIYSFKVTAAPVTGLQTSKWINQQNAKHFTMQLLGTYNKSSLINFVKKHQLKKDTAFFVTQRNNRNWYTLVKGHFTSKQAAQNAITTLPAVVQKTKPWIRQFAAIQSSRLAQKTLIKTPSNDLIEPSQAKPQPRNVTAPQPQALDLTANAAWLWSQNPGHYTLQLLGSHQLKALHIFSKKHQLTKQTTFYRTKRNNRQWFILLYGSYAERDQAKKAIAQLPTAIKQTKPWPRRFADIHAELSSQ